ncbi:hypothetical protein F4803DRAFT_530193 [Xylaria telfairii]|nr:hypothetical protein F4803DRAFT_530193 [Xylaria telfairii]
MSALLALVALSAVSVVFTHNLRLRARVMLISRKSVFRMEKNATDNLHGSFDSEKTCEWCCNNYCDEWAEIIYRDEISLCGISILTYVL